MSRTGLSFLKHFTEAGFSFGDRVLVYCGQFVVLVLLSRAMSPERYGEYCLAISLYVLVSLLPYSALDTAAARLTAENKDPKRFSVFSTVLWGALLLSTAPYLLVGGVMTPAGLAGFSGLTVPMLTLFSLAEVCRVSMLNVENTLRYREINFFSNFFVYGARCAAIELLTWSGEVNTVAIFGSFAAISMVNLGWLIRRGHLTPSIQKIADPAAGQLFGEIWRLAGPIIGCNLFIWCQSMLSRWYLDHFVDSASVGLFTNANTLSTIFPAFALACLIFYFLPIVYDKEKRLPGSGERLNYRVLLAFVPFLVLWVVFLGILGPWCMAILFGSTYRCEPGIILKLGAASAFFNFAGYMVTFFYIRRQFHLLLLPNICGGMFVAIAGWRLIREQQLDGAIQTAVWAAITFFAATAAALIWSGRTRPEPRQR